MFSPELAHAICDGLAEGKSLRAVCRELDVSESTVRGWEKDNADFSAHSLRARELGGHAMADECIDIADAGGDVALARLRIDTRLRLLGKWLPRIYGEKLDLTVNDKRQAEDMSTDELHRIAAAGRAGAAEAPGGTDEPRQVH